MFSLSSDRRSSHGFTLVELLVTIAILAIVATIVAPSFTGLIANQQAKSAASEFAQILRDARSNAILYRRSVDIATAGTTITVTMGNQTPKTTALNSKAVLTGVPGLIRIFPDSTMQTGTGPSDLTAITAIQNFNFTYRSSSDLGYAVSLSPIGTVKMKKNS